jgi:hypothetical protein
MAGGWGVMGCGGGKFVTPPREGYREGRKERAVAGGAGVWSSR